MYRWCLLSGDKRKVQIFGRPLWQVNDPLVYAPFNNERRLIRKTKLSNYTLSSRRKNSFDRLSLSFLNGFNPRWSSKVYRLFLVKCSAHEIFFWRYGVDSLDSSHPFTIISGDVTVRLLQWLNCYPYRYYDLYCNLQCTNILFIWRCTMNHFRWLFSSNFLLLNFLPIAHLSRLNLLAIKANIRTWFKSNLLSYNEFCNDSYAQLSNRNYLFLYRLNKNVYCLAVNRMNHQLRCSIYRSNLYYSLSSF